MARVVFSNLAETTLTATLASGATSVTVADGSGFQTPSGGDYEVLFLLDDADAPSQVEIIHCATRTTNTLSNLVRAQEGTSQPASWPIGTVVSSRLSAGALALLLQVTGDPITLDNGGDAKGALALNIQRGRGSANRVASGAQAVLFCGYGGQASGVESFAFGSTEARAQGDYSGMLGEGNLTGDYSYGLGHEVFVFADYGMGFGFSPDHAIQNAVQMVGIPMLADTDGFYITGGGALTGDRLTAQMCTSQVVLASKVVTVSTTGNDKAVITLPTGVHFLPRHIGFLAVTGSGVTGPEMSAGSTTGGTDILSQTAFTALNDAYDADEKPVTSKAGVASAIYLNVNVAASASMTGRFLVYGLMIED